MASERDAGSSPLDPSAFDPEALDIAAIDRTLRVELAAPAGLPRLEPSRPPPLPKTKPARPIHAQGLAEATPTSTQTSPRTSPRTPTTQPDAKSVPDVILDRDARIVGSENPGFSDLREDLDDSEATPVMPIRASSVHFQRPLPRATPPPPISASGSSIIGLPLDAPLPVGVSTKDIAPSLIPESSSREAIVNLPCSVLVVDEDRRAGAQVAARLVEVGYTCRVSDLAGVMGVLHQEPFDLAVVDVPDDEMRRDQGYARVAAMAPWSGPVVLTADAVMTATQVPMHPQVRAILSKPVLPTELVRTIESSRDDELYGDEHDRRQGAEPTEFGAGPAVTDELESEDSFHISVEVPAIDDHDGASPDYAAGLDDLGPMNAFAPEQTHPDDTRHPVAGRVRITIARLDGRIIRGSVRGASYGGILELEVPESPPLGASVEVEVILLEGQRSDIPGKMVSRPDGVDIALELDAGDVVHFGRFLDEARDPALPPTPALRALERPAGEVGGAAGSPPGLEEMWMAAQERIDDDSVQQAFIQACLKQRQIEYAIRCYRSLKEHCSDDERIERIDKYLHQVGTIVGFFAFQKAQKPTDDGPSMSLGLKIALGLFVLAAFVLLVLGFLVSPIGEP